MGRTNSAVGLGGEFKIDERSLNANLEDEAYSKLVDTSLQYLKYIYSPMEHLFFVQQSYYSILLVLTQVILNLSTAPGFKFRLYFYISSAAGPGFQILGVLFFTCNIYNHARRDGCQALLRVQSSNYTSTGNNLSYVPGTKPRGYSTAHHPLPRLETSNIHYP